VPCMAKRPQQRAARAAVKNHPVCGEPASDARPSGSPASAGSGLQKPRLPEITSCRHMSRLRMLQSACMTPISANAHYRPSRLGSHPGARSIAAVTTVASRTVHWVAFCSARLLSFANHWINGEKLASFCAITIISCRYASNTRAHRRSACARQVCRPARCPPAGPGCARSYNAAPGASRAALCSRRCSDAA
jgi:hypothetical protein